MRAQILPPTSKNICLAARALQAGQVVGMPTETVYGLAGDALRTDALTRIFEAKERPTFDPLIVHVPLLKAHSKLEALHALGLVDPWVLGALACERAEKLMACYWPGPLTLVLPKLPSVPDLATAGLRNVAIRMPRHPVAQQLLAEAQRPLAAPSANRFGRISPTRAAHVLDELGDRISLILDGGPCSIGVESTVLQVTTDGALLLLRPGGISKEEIQVQLGIGVDLGISGEAQGVRLQQSQESLSAPAPGMLENHYAPEKKLFLLTQAFTQKAPLDPTLSNALLNFQGKAGLLLMKGDPAPVEQALSQRTGIPFTVRTLSRDGHLSEMAQNLFSSLRALDHSDAELLFVEPCPIHNGLGYAIADRIWRAVTKKPRT